MGTAKTKGTKQKGHFVHHRHTGKVIHHKHTSFSVLVGILVLITVVFTFCLVSTQKKSDVLSASIELSGVVSAPAPDNAPQITNPVSGLRYQNRSVFISGQCDTDNIVEVYLNGIFAGSTICTKGLFRISVSLFPGENVVTAKLRDALNQTGPESDKVTVFFDQPEELRSPGVEDLFLKVDTNYKGLFPNQTFKTEPEIIGGKGPYHIDIDWQDGDGFHAKIESEGKVLATHVYKEPGVYRAVYTAADSHGRVFRLTSVIVVNGTGANTSNADSNIGVGEIAQSLTNVSVPVWATLAFSTTIVGSFWVGQHMSYARFIKQSRLPKTR